MDLGQRSYRESTGGVLCGYGAKAVSLTLLKDIPIATMPEVVYKLIILVVCS